MLAVRQASLVSWRCNGCNAHVMLAWRQAHVSAGAGIRVVIWRCNGCNAHGACSGWTRKDSTHLFALRECRRRRKGVYSVVYSRGKINSITRSADAGQRLGLEGTPVPRGLLHCDET